MKYKFRKGLTLIEVVVTLALIGLIMIPIFSMFNLGGKSQASIVKDYSVQADIRLASQKLSNYIKKSNAVFLHKSIEEVFSSDIYPETTVTGSVIINRAFIDSSSKKSELEVATEKYKGWNFIVLSSDGKELREFIFHTDTTTGEEYYTMQRIMDMKNSGSDLTYDIQYKMKNSYSDDRLLEFLLVGKYPGGGSEYIDIVSEVEALNSLQVVDRGNSSTPARVLLYRTDDRPIGYDAKAAVAMVLDVSGSMAEDMDGKNNSESRISILKKKSKILLNSMGDLDIDITLAPFSNYAYNSWKVNGVTKNLDKFYNIVTEKSDLDNIIANLTTVSGTNVGDGIRRAYFRIKDYNDIVNEEDDDSIENKDATKYMILLMDGIPTFGSVYKSETNGTFTYRKNNYNYTANNYKNSVFVLSDEEIEDIWYQPSTKYNSGISTGWFGNVIIQTSNIKYGKYYEYVKSGSYTLMNENNSKSDKSIGFYAGNGSISDDELSMGYIKETAKLLANIKNNDNKKNLKVYVIGFSNVAGDREKLNTIKGLISPYVQQVTSFEATSDDELEKVFDGIRQTILEDFWHIYGPKE